MAILYIIVLGMLKPRLRQIGNLQQRKNQNGKEISLESILNAFITFCEEGRRIAVGGWPG
jgi:hypothetical protein